MKKILIIGGSSGLGNYLLKNLNKKYRITAWSSKKNIRRTKYINFKKINYKKKLEHFNFIIYCAAISGFEKSDAKRQLSKFVNIDVITKIIKNIKNNQKLIYISTSGVKSLFRNKIPDYIKQKKIIEKEIKNNLNNYFIVRPCKIIDSMDVFKNNRKIDNFIFFKDKYIYLTSYKIILQTITQIFKTKQKGEVNIISKRKIRMDKLAKFILKGKKITIGEEPKNSIYNLVELSKDFKNVNFKFKKENVYKIINDYIN